MDFKRTRTENLLILRWKQNRLSQVLTLFYSRIPEQNFRFGMIYDCLFESVWFTFREKVAPAKQTFGSLQVVIRVMNDKLQEAEEDNDETQEAGAMTIISMMIDDCPLEMIYDSLFGSRAVSIGL